MFDTKPTLPVLAMDDARFGSFPTGEPILHADPTSVEPRKRTLGLASHTRHMGSVKAGRWACDSSSQTGSLNHAP